VNPDLLRDELALDHPPDQIDAVPSTSEVVVEADLLNLVGGQVRLCHLDVAGTCPAVRLSAGVVNPQLHDQAPQVLP